MDKFSFIGLWDVYSGLLTSTQQEITNLYFNLDLTVSEIAAEKGISRQAVSDCLKGCKKQLEEYEDKLHLFSRLQKLSAEESARSVRILSWAQAFKAVNPAFSGEIAHLERIVQGDYERKQQNKEELSAIGADGQE